MAITVQICLFLGLCSSLDCGVSASMDLYRRYAGFSPAGKRSAMLRRPWFFIHVLYSTNRQLVTQLRFSVQNLCVMQLRKIWHLVPKCCSYWSVLVHLATALICIWIHQLQIYHSLQLQVKLPIVSVHFTFRWWQLCKSSLSHVHISMTTQLATQIVVLIPGNGFLVMFT